MTIVTVSRAERGLHGDPLPAVTHEVEVFAVAPGNPEEITDGGEVAVADLTIYAHKADVDIVHTDQVIFSGTLWDDTYDVVGHPQRYLNPYTGTGRFVALLTSTG